METAIVKINPVEYGLTVETAAKIEAQFLPMLEKMTELENEYNAILGLNIEEPKTAKAAKELRLKYVKIRTATADIHKAQKDFFLKGGRFVDGWKNAQLFASQGKEEQLESIEKHAENMERERLGKLQELRAALLQPYLGEHDSVNGLSTMQADVFEAYLSAKKQGFEDRKAAELKAENDRIERERLEAEARELQRLENIRLKAEADKREAEIEAERARVEMERKAEREKAEKEAAKIREENEKRLRAEQAERARVEMELKAKKDAELKIENDRIAAEKAAKLAAEKLAKSSIKLQLTAWIAEFQMPKSNIEHEKKTLIEAKYLRFLEWSKAEIESI